MRSLKMSEIRLLLDRLEDPFEMFAMQGGLRTLSDNTEEQNESRGDRSGPLGVSPIYYSVEDEHDIEVVEIFIGSGFVLGQEAITQAISIVKTVDKVVDGLGMSKKAEIMKTVAPCHAQVELSKIVIIDAVANCFKHHREWHDDWSDPDGCGKQTIEVVRKLGLVPKGKHNMEVALRTLEIMPSNMAPLGQLVTEWREKLATHIRGQVEASRQARSVP